MKTLELNLQKRLLIVEGDMLDFKLNDKRWLNDKIKFICKGSELTEEIAKGLIVEHYHYEGGGEMYTNHKRWTNHIECFHSAKPSFISAIEAQGYYWGENPIDFDNDENDLGKRHKMRVDWERAESKTFNPEKTLIFEILL